MVQKTEYRLYSFSNYYLSSLQKGLQTAHLVEELNLKYTLTGAIGWRSLSNDFKTMYNILQEWGKYHKTIIILNGGNSENLQSIYDNLLQLGNQLSLPVAKFNEDEKSLNNALTCVGIVVPMNLMTYVPPTVTWNSDGSGYKPPQIQLQELIKGYGLAN